MPAPLLVRPALAGSAPTPPVHAPAAAPATAPAGPTVDAVAARLLKLFDDNGNGTVTRAEFATLAPPKAPAAALDNLNKLFDRLDADHNGSLSGAEVKAVVAHADVNGNGHIGPMEALHHPVTLIGLHPLGAHPPVHT